MSPAPECEGCEDEKARKSRRAAELEKRRVRLAVARAVWTAVARTGALCATGLAVAQLVFGAQGSWLSTAQTAGIFWLLVQNDNLHRRVVVLERQGLKLGVGLPGGDDADDAEPEPVRN